MLKCYAVFKCTGAKPKRQGNVSGVHASRLGLEIEMEYEYSTIYALIG